MLICKFLHPFAMCLKNHQVTYCPMSISFNLLKIDYAFNCKFLFWFNNDISICELWSGGNGKWNLHTSCFLLWQVCLWWWSWFSQKNSSNKHLSQVMYISINDFILSLLSIPYFGASFIHKSPWLCSFPLLWNFITKNKSFTCPNNVFVDDNNLQKHFIQWS